MAEINIPVIIDLDDLSTLTVGLPAAARAGAAEAGAAIAEELGKGTTQADKDVRALGDTFKRLKGRVAELREENAKLLPEFKGIGAEKKEIGAIETAISSLALGIVEAVTPVGLLKLGFEAMFAVMAGGIIVAAAATAGVISLVLAYEDLNETVEKFQKNGLGISPEEEAQLERSKAALDAIQTVIAQASIEIASDFAPMVERVATLLVAMGLAGLDAFNALGGGVTVARRLIIGFIAGALGPLQGALGTVASTIRIFAAIMGDELDPVAQSQLAAMEDLSTFLVDSTVPAFEALEFVTSDYRQEAEALVGTQIQVNRAIKDGGKAAKEAEKELKRLQKEERERAKKQQELIDTIAQLEFNRLGPLEQVRASYAAQILEVEALAIASGDLTSGEMARVLLLEEMKVKLREVREELLADTEAADRFARSLEEAETSPGQLLKGFQALGGGIIDVINLQAARWDEETEEGKKRLQKLWKSTQAISIAQTIAAGAVSVAQALAQLGPIAGPIAIAGIIATTIAGALATIRNTEPDFAHGGFIGPEFGADSAGRVRTIVEQEESVLNQRATREFGGRDAVNAANAGMGTNSGPSVIQIVFRDRVLDEMVSEIMQGPSRLAKAVREATSTPGVVGVLA